MDAELERKNLRLGIAFFVLFLVIFGAVIGAAFLYLALD
jgi:hypothetical protein